MLLPPMSPFEPPQLRFLTRIYHPNIDRLGRICLDVLADHWSPALNFAKLFVNILDLLSSPNCKDPIDPVLGEHFQKKPEEAVAEAKKWNDVYAVVDGIEPGSPGFVPCLVLQVHTLPNANEMQHTVQGINFAGEVKAEATLDYSATLGDLRRALFLTGMNTQAFGPAEKFDDQQRETHGSDHGLSWFGPPDRQHLSYIRLVACNKELSGPDDLPLTSTHLLLHRLAAPVEPSDASAVEADLESLI
mmetsp:Transcript_115415/g.224429  ORF Transcript_115415/g.224429 Transcript_115415/m.224429 type:complete len:246 (+) Transcript_115415:3-740(+)